MQFSSRLTLHFASFTPGQSYLVFLSLEIAWRHLWEVHRRVFECWFLTYCAFKIEESSSSLSFIYIFSELPDSYYDISATSSGDIFLERSWDFHWTDEGILNVCSNSQIWNQSYLSSAEKHAPGVKLSSQLYLRLMLWHPELDSQCLIGL